MVESIRVGPPSTRSSSAVPRWCPAPATTSSLEPRPEAGATLRAAVPARRRQRRGGLGRAAIRWRLSSPKRAVPRDGLARI